MNDLVLVRDVTSGAFALIYIPNYRIMAIHGPNRIVVRDEKGNKTVRRASHLKVCDLKEKVSAMTPEEDEYSKFGRSTRLLLHPKDVPDLHFTRKTGGKGKILPNTEVSLVELMSESRKTIGNTDLIEICNEILPKAEIDVQTPIINSNEQYIVGYTEDLKKHSEIPPVAVVNREVDKTCENFNWFQNPVNCVSKWSKVLKIGLGNSVGLDSTDTAGRNLRENDKLGFSFLL